MSDKWTADRIPDQTGRNVIITGANSGVGFVESRELARKGARVILACRNAAKAEKAMAEIKATVPNANIEFEQLDLASLDSVRSFADRINQRGEPLDVLINNAGLMAPPRGRTADGFELQFGTNHLGHFALTNLLLPLMEGRRDARVVTVSSNAHKLWRINFDNLQGDRNYFRWNAYNQSKLANLMFALELERRLRAIDSPIISLAAQPGYAATNLHQSAPGFDRAVMAVLERFAAHPAEIGALSILHAAVEPGLSGGIYVEPERMLGLRGYPSIGKPTSAARDEANAKRLWQVSEELTGTTFPL
jgi:NAD(P)-dependent dehydrogenase (short-subunit alcohol dehydrogenase family)